MAASHESFVKGDTNKSAEQIQKAAAYVKRESNEVAADAKEGVKKAADDLDGLGRDVKKGVVKSGGRPQAPLTACRTYGEGRFCDRRRNFQRRLYLEVT
jgi:hypothetical protein